MEIRKIKPAGKCLSLFGVLAVGGLFLLSCPASAIDSTGHFSRGKVYWDQGEYDLALNEYQAVIDLLGDDAAARHNRALIYLETDHAPEARDEAARAVELAPHEGHYRLTFGVVLLAQQEPELAEARKQLLAAITPMTYAKDADGLLRVYYNLGLVAKQDRLIVDARRWWRKALEIDPNDEPTRTALDGLEGSGK